MLAMRLCAAALALALAGAGAARQGVSVGHGEATPYTAAQRPAKAAAPAAASFPACTRIDGFCADAHPLMFNDPVPDFFRCKTNSDCNDHECLRGKCNCKGGNLFNNCGAMLMYHREWEHVKRNRPDLAQGQRTVPHPMTYLLKGDYLAIPEGTVMHPALHVAADETINIPSNTFFEMMARDDNFMQRLWVLTNEWSLIQDLAGRRDNATAPKLFREISFMLACVLESPYAYNNGVDMTALLWRQLGTINTGLTWAMKNCLRFNSHNQVKRIGLQEYGRGFFFKVFELLLSASHHPNARLDLHITGEEYINRPATMMQRVVKLMFHELIRLLIDAGTPLAGTLSVAVVNTDLEATRTLVEYGGVDPAAADQLDEYGRSPLQLAAITRKFSHDDVFGYLCSRLPGAPECAPAERTLSTCGFDQRCDLPRVADGAAAASSSGGSDAVPTSGAPRDSVFLHNVGASLALNCPFTQYAREEVTADLFRREALTTGSPVFLNNITDDWPIHELWTLDSLKNNFGDLEVSVGRIPYGYRFGREYHKEPLRNYVEYLEGMIESDLPPTETPQYVFDAEVLEMPAFVNASFRVEQYPAKGDRQWPDSSYLPSYLHPDRFIWMKEGVLNDVYGTVLGDGTNRAHQWFLGPKESGAPLHHHCQAFNTMISGRKLWLIFPPSHPQMGVGYSNMEAVVWLRRTALLNPDILTHPERYGMMTCVQEAGQTIFIPTHWTHATINVEPAVGFAAECFANC